MRVAVFASVLLVAGASRADDPEIFGALGNSTIIVTKARATPPIRDEELGLEPGWFTTLGSAGRLWELRADAAFSTNRAFTQRVELAHFFSLSRYQTEDGTRVGEQLGLVVRASFGIADDTTNGVYNPLGPLPSIGLRLRTPSDAEWIEFGARLLIPYPGPSNALPEMQVLAFKATTSSGIADDAAWLPIDSFGAQLYLATQARLTPFYISSLLTSVGVAGGGQISLGSVDVATWLGPQPNFLGNAYFELFFDAQLWRRTKLNLQIGGHAEVSLSACWPGANALPVLVNGFVGWSPVKPFAMRLFYGIGESVKAGVAVQEYGVRAQVYVP